MKVIIEDEYLARLYLNTKPDGKPKYSSDIAVGFVKRVIQIEQAPDTQILRTIKSLHFEKLTGKLEGKYSIRVNKAYRIIFRIEKDDLNMRIEIICIEEMNNHYS